MLAEGRVYGGILHKLAQFCWPLTPEKLTNVPANALAALFEEHTAEQEPVVLANLAQLLIEFFAEVFLKRFAVADVGAISVFEIG